MKSDEEPFSTPPGGEILLYEAPDGQVRVDVRLEQARVWPSLNQIRRCSNDIVIDFMDFTDYFCRWRVGAGGSCCKKYNNCGRR